MDGNEEAFWSEGNSREITHSLCTIVVVISTPVTVTPTAKPWAKMREWIPNDSRGISNSLLGLIPHSLLAPV